MVPDECVGLMCGWDLKWQFEHEGGECINVDGIPRTETKHREATWIWSTRPTKDPPRHREKSRMCVGSSC